VIEDVAKLSADLVVVSGNLTRAGTGSQFADAKSFLQKLGVPSVVVPGPRDLGGLNFFARLFNPLRAWNAAMGSDVPFFENREIAVLGVDTSRAGMSKRISSTQAGLIRDKLGGQSKITVLVSHHTLVPRPTTGTTTQARTEAMDLRVVGSCVDVVLAGHQAAGGPQYTRIAYRVLDKQTIVAQAVLSSAAQGVRDSTPYSNAVRIDGDRVSIAVRVWRGKGFEEQGPKSYRYTGTQWEKVVDMPPDFQWNDSG
jgi:3',5'-cyclic AMP phosphodiesterase CpdA